MLNKILTIEDKDYLVTLSCEYNDLNYYFLINVSDSNDFKYCYEKEGRLIEILDVNEVFKIAQIFSKMIIDRK